MHCCCQMCDRARNLLRSGVHAFDKASFETLSCEKFHTGVLLSKHGVMECLSGGLGYVYMQLHGR